MPAQQRTEEVTVDSLQSSLDDLIKAADATDLIKAGDSNRVEHSGTEGSDGKQGGGRGSYPGDVEIDSLMIGKLATLGFSAGQIAQMSGALKGKSEDGDEDDADGEDDGLEGYLGKLKGAAKEYKAKNGSMKGFPGLPMGKSSTTGAGEPMIKSMDQFRQDPDIDEAVDASAYLEAFTARVAEQLDGVNGSMRKGFHEQSSTNRALAAALYQTGQLLKSQSALVSELSKRLGIVERQPMPQKGVTNAAALNKSMPNEVGGRRPPEALTKAETVAVLSYMNLEKGIKQLNGRPTSQVIGLLEGGNVASEQDVVEVHKFLAQNPNESAAARQYH